MVWILTATAIFLSRWRRKASGAGLVLAYVLNLWLIHWPAALIYLLPWYAYQDPHVVELGFQQSTYAIVAFGAGSVLLAPFALRLFGRPAPEVARRVPDPRLSRMYLVIGLVSYLVLLPLAGVIPTATALVSAGWNLVVVGLALSCWHAWQEKRKRKFIVWLLASMGLPLLTTVSEGFLGYGTFALITVLTFIATFYRPRWRLVAAGLVLGYFGISLYVSYMRDRKEIREVVWGGASIVDRFHRMFSTLGDLEWFDPYDNTHLFRIDDRLNQNYLVGTSVLYLGTGFERFAAGETLWHAVVALVPRAIWPGKPLVGGSGDLVSRFTGIEFAQGTSVGVGQVLEFYVNFGTAGVAVGFLFLGIVITVFDSMAWLYLQKGDWQTFTLWYLPAIGLLQAGGSLAEVTASTGAGLATALLVNRYVLPRLGGRRAISASVRGRIAGLPAVRAPRRRRNPTDGRDAP
jgi:predicted membrane channel-forming protein YqfA (hemolysin III family)